jgi:hypothetical protein
VPVPGGEILERKEMKKIVRVERKNRVPLGEAGVAFAGLIRQFCDGEPVKEKCIKRGVIMDDGFDPLCHNSPWRTAAVPAGRRGTVTTRPTGSRSGAPSL